MTKTKKEVQRYLDYTKGKFELDGWWHFTPEHLVKAEPPTAWLVNHNLNEDYWKILYGPVTANPEKWKDKKAFDIGSGFGGNMRNLLELAEWSSVDGCDISGNNAEFATEYLELCGFPSDRFSVYENDGFGLQESADSHYDFVTSIVVLQHVSLHSVRFNIMKEAFRILKTDGVFSFQLLKSGGTGKPYHFDDVEESLKNRYNAFTEDNSFLIEDLTKIGFRNIEIVPTANPGAPTGEWIYVRCEK